MQALSDILTELNAVYNPQKDNYNQQLAGLDPWMQAETKGLEAAQQDSFGQIQQGANRRGLNFSGIPIAEQARYTGQTFLPAVANMKAKFAQQKFNLQDAIAKITAEQYNRAYDIRQKQMDTEAAERAAAAARAGAGGGGFAPGGGGGGGGGDGKVQGATTSLQNFLANQYKNNPRATRAEQDSWVRYYAQLTGGNANDPALWREYNNMYPWEQWNDTRWYRRPVTGAPTQPVGPFGPNQQTLRQQSGGLQIPALGVR